MSSTEEILKKKYPAKAHFDRVLTYVQKHVTPLTEPGSKSRGVVYLESAKTRRWPNCDQDQPFRQDRHFFYVTGCELADSYVIYDIETKKSTLFIPPVNDAEVVWSGLPVTVEEAKQRYEVDDVKTSDSVGEALRKESFSKPYVWMLEEETKDDAKLRYFDHYRVGVKEAIEECRVVKDEYEIALTRRANEVSAIAHSVVMNAAKKAQSEAELAGLFVTKCMMHGCSNQAYSPIVAAGTDAATLHYVKNDKPLDKSTLNLLVDASPEYSCYAADITRTFPINGKFTAESAAIYKLVLHMQKECIAQLKAGVVWDEVHMHAHKLAVEGLLELGILKGKAEEILAARTSAAFFPHGLGHYLGMDTHDTGGHPNYADEVELFKYLRVRGQLPAGSIITVEPGIYFCRFMIEPRLKDPKHKQFISEEVLDKYWQVGGVRIEDDVLITESGYENLTTVPKELDELEKLLAG